MRIAVLYTIVARGPLAEDYAARFVATWQAYPPGTECDLIACCNGGPPSLEAHVILSPLSAQFFVTDNVGWDIGGYLKAARGPAVDYEAVLLCGESVYFWRPGWLARLVEAWGSEGGEGIYGPFASYLVRPHLNSTCLFTSPALLRRYPFRVEGHAGRYEFEHGQRSFWLQVQDRWHKPARLVTWDGVWPWRMWRQPADILWRGDQGNLLVRCNHTDRFDGASEAVRVDWSRGADGRNNQWAARHERQMAAR